MMKYYLFSDTMTDESILYKSTFAGIEQNVASCLEEVKTAEGARHQDLQFDRDKFWDSLTTAARKVSVTSREYRYFTTAARKVSVTSREYGTVLHYSCAEGQCDVQRVPVLHYSCAEGQCDVQRVPVLHYNCAERSV
jgi:hypothetical protein